MKTGGVYIVIEGIEGVGKTTVINRLARELQALQIPVQIMAGSSQPQDITAQAVQRIIDDSRYPAANRTDVLLYNAVSSQSLEAIRQIVATGAVCIADHSYLTALVHEYYGRGDITDYETASRMIDYAASDPKPDLLILLDAPVAAIRPRLSAERQSGLDEAYQERLRAGYLWEAKQQNLPVVHSTGSADAVFAGVWQQVSGLVNASPKPAAGSGAQSVAEVLAVKPPVQVSPAEPPTVLPAIQTVRNVQPLTASPGSLPQTVKPAAETATTTVSGPTSATTLTVSELAAGRLPRYGHMARFTQDTEASDAKDADGQYRYYIPTSLSEELRVQYVRDMDQLFNTHAGLVSSLTKHLQATDTGEAGRAEAEVQARAAVSILLPAAASKTVAISTTPRTAEKLAAELQVSSLPEIVALGRQLNASGVGMTDTSASAAAFKAVQAIADDLLPGSHTDSTSSTITLSGYTPHNELDIVAGILYEHSDLPLADVQASVANAAYQRKTDVLQAYLGDQPTGRHASLSALTTMRYSFDIISSYAVFRDLQVLRPFRRVTVQPISPRLGYKIPALIEAADATDIFEHCFDISLRLYSALQAGNSPMEAQYAALLGHNVRWNVVLNATNILHLQEIITDSKYRLSEDAQQLIESVLAKVAEVHPVLADAMHLQASRTY